MATQTGFYIADRERVEAVIDVMARQVHARVEEDIVIVGIRRRGVPLANALAERLGALINTPFEVEEITLKRYADDLSLLHERAELKETPSSLEVKDTPVLLVDDVLYTGQTLLQAINVVVEAGAERVYSAVLCSRGPNDIPVIANVVGMQLDVGPGNVIEVHIPPYEDEMAVVIQHQSDV